jgi:hypothetical protein
MKVHDEIIESAWNSGRKDEAKGTPEEGIKSPP